MTRLRSIPILMLGASLLLALATAPPAGATTTAIFRGTAVCESGRTIVKITLSSSAGDGGAATMTRATTNMAYYYKYMNLSATSSNVRVKVGCGGTASAPASMSDSWTHTVTSSGYVYNMWCADPATGIGTCSGAPLAGTKSTTTTSWGQCTRGAAVMWKKATGTYPSWMGHAHQWNENARAQGFKVVDWPRERAVAVWEAWTGGSREYGHVAWVTKAWQEGGDVRRFDIVEMNWPTEGEWNYRSGLVDDGNVSFIVAPPGPRVLNP